MGLHLKRVFAIRRARPADVARFTEIAHAAKRHWGYAESEIALWRRDLTVTPELLGADVYFCAEEDGVVAGFAAVSFDGDAAELEHLWVDPPAMGRGHGAALFRHALAVAGEHGATALRIASDPNAEQFYLRLGAVRVGEVASTPPGRMLPVLSARTTIDRRPQSAYRSA